MYRGINTRRIPCSGGIPPRYAPFMAEGVCIERHVVVYRPLRRLMNSKEMKSMDLQWDAKGAAHIRGLGRWSREIHVTLGRDPAFRSQSLNL